MSRRSVSAKQPRGPSINRRFLIGGLAAVSATQAAAEDKWWERLHSPTAGDAATPARAVAPLVTRRLDAPDFDALHPTTKFVAGVRPIRGGGMRITYGKALDVDGQRKTIVHNYGHGGAGISLAFAAAETARDLVANAVGATNAPSIAIVGAGVIGLTTARAVLERFPDAVVTIYAKHTDAMATTSYWAGGQFAVASSLDEYASATERRMLMEHLATSERVLERQTAKGEAARYGIARRTAYSLSQRGGVRLLLGQNTIVAGQYQSWLIDPTRLLPALRAELEGRGVRFVARTFDTRADLATLAELVVVNCTGAGAAALFDDITMRPCRGHLVVLQNPGKLDYFLNTWCSSGRVNHIFARHDDIVLGGSIQWEPTGDQFDPENGADVRTCERILRNARGLFEPRGQGMC